MNDAQRMLERARLRKVEFEQHIKNLDLETETHELLMEKETNSTSWNTYKTDEKENIELSPSKYGLRNVVKVKLDKLGKLYAGEEVSSPIHRSFENENLSPTIPGVAGGKLSQARTARLAALANTINNWEDDLSHSKKTSPIKSTPGKPKVLGDRNGIGKKQESKMNEVKTPSKVTKKIVIEDSIAKTLEAQGFQRCESKQHLVYDYSSPKTSPGKCLNKTTNVHSPAKSPIRTIPKIVDAVEKIQKESDFENSSHRFVKNSQPREVLKIAAKYEEANSPKKIIPKDPAELSLADRKALFERGDNGTAILPKAPFAMAVPPKLLRSELNKPGSPMHKTPTSRNFPAKNPYLGSTSKQKPDWIQNESIERPIHDNVTREVLERRKEIEQLRNRWDNKRIEVENKMLIDSEGTLKTPKTHIPAPPAMPSAPIFGENSANTSRLRNSSFTNEYSPSSSTKRDRNCSISPEVKTALVGLKPIRVSPPKGLYPSVADIETDSDMMEEDRQSYLEVISENGEDRISENSGSMNEVYESSLESENSLMSFGKHVVASSRENSRSNLKRAAEMKIMINSFSISTDNNSNSTASFSSETPSISDQGIKQYITADESKVLHEIDDFLDEALGEPTPPKKLKEFNTKDDEFTTAMIVGETVKQYTSPQKYQTVNKMEDNRQVTPTSEEIPASRTVGNEAPSTPLVYTVSLYRKQQTNLIKTPIKRDVHTDLSIMVNESPDNSISEEEIVKQKMEELKIEIKRQITIISQASQALNLCMSSIEFSGSTEELEAEKLLLLATARRMVATHELERLTVEQKLHSDNKSEFTEDGTLKIESLAVKAKRVPSALDETIHILCLVKSGCSVQATEIQPLTRQALVDNRLLFKKPIKIEHASHNSQTTVEVYAITNKGFMYLHHLKGENNKEKLKLTPKKSGKKENKRHFGVIESPAGPNAVRSPSFQMIGFVVFSLKDISRNHFTLNKVPGHAPIEGFLEMKVKGQVNLDSVRHEGFLTLFQEIGGFGAWKRAWSILRGHHISFCSYPDPERAMSSCFETIDLSECISREVGLAPKDICVRTDTFMLECKRIGETEVIRHLLSADSLQERLQWCQYINKILNILRLWNPLRK